MVKCRNERITNLGNIFQAKLIIEKLHCMYMLTAFTNSVVYKNGSGGLRDVFCHKARMVL